MPDLGDPIDDGVRLVVRADCPPGVIYGVDPESYREYLRQKKKVEEALLLRYRVIRRGLLPKESPWPYGVIRRPMP